MSAPAIDRRSFLQAGAAAAGGLLVSVWWRPAVVGAAEQAGTSAALTAFVEIAPDGTVTITAPRPETGQGVKTSMAMLVAEELDADWARVRVKDAEILDEGRYLDQFTGGSTSVSESFLPLRRAGAAARALLVGAAAESWGVEPASCETEPGVVLHRASGRRAEYGTLAARAVGKTPPESAPLKDPARFRIIGKETRSVDHREVVTGATRYGLDVRVPGMRVAVVARCPVLGGRLKSFDAARAAAVPGVRAVVPLEPAAATLPSGRPLTTGAGVAVIADSTWAALAGRSRLTVEWEEGAGVSESTPALSRQLAALVGEPSKVSLRSDGDFEAAFSGASLRHESVYEIPFVAASPMEPCNATASVSGGKCELWAPTQAPGNARAFAGAALGLPRDAWASSVTVHPLRPGGGFGRRLDQDYAAEAAAVAKAAGVPVQLLWTREDELRHGLYRTTSAHRLRAGLDAQGKPVAWEHRVASPSRYRYQKSSSPAQSSEVTADDFPAGRVANFRVGWSEAESLVPRGYFRSMVPGMSLFPIESFLDELAHAARKDPVAFRLALAGDAAKLPYKGHGTETLETARLRKVLETAADRARWGGKLPAGRHRGVAFGLVFGAYVAEVVELSVAKGDIRVHKVVAAVDCGLVVNPAGAVKQIESGVMDGLALALRLAITFEKGRVVQENFGDYAFLRMREAPAIEVHLIDSGEPPVGLGEMGVPPASPAVANAVFAATGTRLRRLPMRLPEAG
ncbi:MAG TPA: molybdopterin cofactor-binding domain-containing protein [Thermoanaerobaculia bacterium]